MVNLLTYMVRFPFWTGKNIILLASCGFSAKNIILLASGGFSAIFGIPIAVGNSQPYTFDNTRG